jgi:hypothetical protein
MAKLAVQIPRFARVESQENTCSMLLSSISYANWPTTFVGGASYGKSRLSIKKDGRSMLVQLVLFVAYILLPVGIAFAAWPISMGLTWALSLFLGY